MSPNVTIISDTNTVVNSYLKQDVPRFVNVKNPSKSLNSRNAEIKLDMMSNLSVEELKNQGYDSSKIAEIVDDRKGTAQGYYKSSVHFPVKTKTNSFKSPKHDYSPVYQKQDPNAFLKKFQSEKVSLYLSTFTETTWI